MIISLRQRVLLERQQKARFFLGERQGIPQYERYYFSVREKPVYLAAGLGITLFFSVFFYRSLFAVLFLWPIGVGVYQMLQKEKGKKRRQRLEAEFKDCILSVAANLRAGYAVENAFLEAIKDMRALYGEEGLMLKELYRMRKGISNHVPLEKLLRELGERSCCESVKEFGEVFTIARASGGNLPEVIQSTAGLIGESISLHQEIQTLISGRVFEQRIMNVMPFLLVGYIEATNKGFFAVLYHNFFGQAVMTGCLMVYLTAYGLAGKICKTA